MRHLPRPLADLVLAATVLAAAGRAHALPDLVPEVFDLRIDENASVDPGDVVEGCTAAASGRRLVRFALRTRNVGASDLVMGDPGCPDCAAHPGDACANPLFVCSEAHGHAHFEGFAGAELLDQNGQVVAVGHKQGFCLIDIECPTPQYGCGFQGITAGCADVYDSGLPCQYVDVTGLALPDGPYTLRVTLDEDQRIAEADEQNNTIMVPFQIGPTPAVCPAHDSTDVPAGMPDLGSGDSSLVLPDLGRVEGIRVRLASTHTYLSDLHIALTSPSGRTVVLADHVCGASPGGFTLYLGDEAPAAGGCVGGGTLARPSEPLAGFVGEPAGGTWTLSWQDTVGTDAGQLTAWSLEVCGGCGNGVLDDGELCDDGNTLDGDCCSGGCQVALGDGTPCSDADVCTLGDVCAGGVCVHSSRQSCPGCLPCDPSAGCAGGAMPACAEARPRRSSVSLHDDPSQARDALTWSWASWIDIPPAAFGRPESTTDLKVCLFDGTGLRLESHLPAGGACAGRPCWKPSSRGATYADPERTPDGVQSLRIAGGNPAKLKLKARGPQLVAPALPLDAPVTLRLIREDTNACWQAVFSSPVKNGPADLKGRSD